MVPRQLPFVVLFACACDSAPVPQSDLLSVRVDAAAPAPTGSNGPDSAAPSDAGAVADAATPADVTEIPQKPGSDNACQLPLAWWAVSPAFDVNKTPSDFANAVNPLIVNQHPIAIADDVDVNKVWTMRASGTATNGNFQQYFPFDHSPDIVPMTRQVSSFQTGSSESNAWIVVQDANKAAVWIAITAATVTADYSDAYCQSLTNGVLDAVVPASAGPTAINTQQGPTTLGALFGAQTSQSPAGWNVELRFDGQKVQVSNK